MTYSDTLEITPEEFFDAIGSSLLMDIKNSTGKDYQMKDLKRGFHYQKSIKTSDKKLVNAKVLIKEFNIPISYQAEFMNGEDITQISYSVEPLDNNTCKVNYQEVFITNKKANQNSYNIMSFFMKRKAKKKIIRLFSEIEAYGIEKRNLINETY